MLEDYAKVIQRHDVFVLNFCEKISGVFFATLLLSDK
jgi:hypothetical protein